MTDSLDWSQPESRVWIDSCGPKAWLSLSVAGLLHVGGAAVSKRVEDIMRVQHSRQVLIKEDGSYIIDAHFFSGNVTATLNREPIRLSGSYSSHFLVGGAVASRFSFRIEAHRGDIVTFSKEPVEKSIRRVDAPMFYDTLNSPVSVAQLD